jgi:DNA-binding response OmpR family regulator
MQDAALNVLVVEDDQSILSIIADTLADGGFQPVVASSGEDALTVLSANNYRVLVVDIAFGTDRLRGWDVARRARAINAELPVVYITGGSGHEWAAQAVTNSILLNKPFAPVQLLTALSQLLNAAPQRAEPVQLLAGLFR